MGGEEVFWTVTLGVFAAGAGSWRATTVTGAATPRTLRFVGAVIGALGSIGLITEIASFSSGG